MELASEKGTYSQFTGSEWETGQYFERKEYVSERWKVLRKEVGDKGIRNGWLMAVAPNSIFLRQGDH